MTNEEKNLFKDICAKLPYGIKAQVCERNDEDGSYFFSNCKIIGAKTNGLIQFIRIDDEGNECGRDDWWHISWFKPYARPVETMTEEEEKEYLDILRLSVPVTKKCGVDYFNEKHFDYHYLVPCNIALKAPEGMYETKD